MTRRMPLLNIDLHVSPDFSGRILLYIENGLVKSEMPLLPNEIIGTPALFNHLLERAGYRIAPVQKD